MNIDLGTEYWLTDYSREKLNTAMEKASKKYNIEKIKNELTYLNIKRIQKKAERGEELSEKEKEVYSFVEETKRLYFSSTETENKLTVNIEDINEKLGNNEKLYTINEKGEKELSYENINRFLWKYTKNNTKIITAKNLGNAEYKVQVAASKEVEDTISSVYTLIYEEKILKNSEYQKFQNEWIAKAISNIYNGDLKEEFQYYFANAEWKNLNAEKVTKKIYDIMGETIDHALNKYLYKNYNGNKFNATFNMNNEGRWIFPEYKFNVGTDPNYSYNPVEKINIISMGYVISDAKIATFSHETNHGVQVFFDINYDQLGNKGYNDKLVDVGRWFKLNSYFLAHPYHTGIYGKNIRELDSFSINIGSSSKYNYHKKLLNEGEKID